MKSRWCCLVLSMVALLASACAAPSWPMFRQNPAGTGLTSPWISPSNVAPLALDFTADLGGGSSDLTFAQPLAPAIVNGRIYAVHNGKLLVFDVNGVDGCTRAPKTCAPQWTANLYGAPGSGFV